MHQNAQAHILKGMCCTRASSQVGRRLGRRACTNIQAVSVPQETASFSKASASGRGILNSFVYMHLAQRDSIFVGIPSLQVRHKLQNAAALMNSCAVTLTGAPFKDEQVVTTSSWETVHLNVCAAVAARSSAEVTSSTVVRTQRDVVLKSAALPLSDSRCLHSLEAVVT